jgi:RNA polymerase sigma-70 factor, ECF subfamily
MGRREGQDELYQKAVAEHGDALARLTRGYEGDADLRRDLMQDIHIALWRSFAGFDGRCSMRTWVYRIAHNVAATHVLRGRKARSRTLVGLDELMERPNSDDPERFLGDRQTLARLTELIQSLQPADRQVILLYLEGLSAAEIGEVAGLSAGAAATKVHRIKQLLAQRFRQEARP